jgi:hypothetical protein
MYDVTKPQVIILGEKLYPRSQTYRKSDQQNSGYNDEWQYEKYNIYICEKNRLFTVKCRNMSTSLRKRLITILLKYR